MPEDSNMRPGFKLDYQSLTLHALTPASSDGNPDRAAHLYCQIDDGQAGLGGGEEDEDDYGQMRELRVFVPEGQCEFDTLHIRPSVSIFYGQSRVFFYSYILADPDSITIIRGNSRLFGTSCLPHAFW